MTPSMSLALSAFAKSSMRSRMRASAIVCSSFDLTNRALSSRQDEEPPVSHEGSQDEQYHGHGDHRVLATPRVRKGDSDHRQHQTEGGQRRQPGHDPRQRRQHDPDRPKTSRAPMTRTVGREKSSTHAMFSSSFSL